MAKAVLKPQCGAKVERRQLQRICGTAAAAHPMLELLGGRRAGGTSRTHRILAETLRQRGNSVVTNARIRIFGDGQHIGDWPRGTHAGVAIEHATSEVGG